MIAELVTDLQREAERANERRLLVLAGDRDHGIDAAYDAIAATGVDDEAVSFVSTREGFRFDRTGPRGTDELLGRTRDVVVLDCHEQFVPNALGRTVGAVDGGGLLVVLTPPLDEWPTVRDRFDESLAVPPFTLADVTGRFRRRLVETLRTHPGVAVASLSRTTDGSTGSGDDCDTDLESDTDTRSDDDVTPQNASLKIERDGLTNPTAARSRSTSTPPPTSTFPRQAYEACLTTDQVRALHALESLSTPGSAVVIESDRGRGKSSAAGLAAGALALAGQDVLVTAPDVRNAREVFARASELVAAVDDGRTAETAGQTARQDAETARQDDDRTGRDGESNLNDYRYLCVSGGGRVRFVSPAVAVSLPGEPDAVVVDEAAALPVRLLEGFLDAPSVAFCTTVHGYEGAGRGFAVRFRDRLAESEFTTRDVRLDEPIRYAVDDPVESWAARALRLDARPPVSEAVAETTVEDVRYRRLDPDELVDDEVLLGEAFGLLVAAHYRTEPNDLARLLDAPNLETRALVAGGNGRNSTGDSATGGHVVAVALLAREGDLPATTRSAMYEGARVRGNMVPDVLTSQLRDERAAAPRGLRTVRIATHHTLRGRGLGSHLLDRVHEEFGDSVDYFSVGFGATPRLLRFWDRSGYRSVHLSTTRNDASGEYSAVMLRPETAAGKALLDRHAAALRDRERDALSDAHRDLDADVVRGVLAACPAPVVLDLTPTEWRAVVSASFGPGTYEVAPGAFRDLAMATLVGTRTDTPEATGDPDSGAGTAAANSDRDRRSRGSDPHDREPRTLDAREERLLVQKVLQAQSWATVADALDYASTTACMRALGEAGEPLVERYGTKTALADRDRFVDR